MEVKILCPCGAKYKFDVEPLNGALPGPVKCPVCGADGTELGNQIVARQLAPAAAPARSGFVAPAIPRSSKVAAAPAAAHPVTIPVPAVAPSPAAAAPAVVVPKPAGPSALTVAAAHSAPAAAAPVSAPPVPHVRGPAAKPSAPAVAPSFTRGLVGIGTASVLGLIFWFVFTLYLGARFKWIGIALGAMIGWSGQWLAKERSQRLGIAAATATGLVMILGLLWSARQEAIEAVNFDLRMLWEERVEYAKAATKAAQSDTDLRKFLAEYGDPPEAANDEEDVADIVTALTRTPENITAKELADFRSKELPDLRKVAEGSVSRSSFERQARPVFEQAYTTGFIIGRTLKVRVLGILVVAVVAAWKICAPSS